MTDEPSPTPTVRTRLRDAGLSDERIEHWLSLEEGAVRLDDEPVVDGNSPAPWPSRIVLRG